MMRRRMPNRRPHELLNLEHSGFRFVLGVGRFNDGTLAELFLNCTKGGTPVDGLEQQLCDDGADREEWGPKACCEEEEGERRILDEEYDEWCRCYPFLATDNT
jgi:hypothetical protein